MSRITNEEATRRIEARGFELITDYISHDDPITLKCKCGKITTFEKAIETWGGRKKICRCWEGKFEGQTFGRLHVNGRHTEKSPKGELLWDCDCACGNKRYLTSWDLSSKRYSSCGCLRNEKTSERMFKGYRDIRASYFNKLKKGAECRGIKFNVTIEDIWDLFEKQNMKCALSGVKLTLERFANDRMNQNASLDRIDSNIGYEVDNIQWVSKDINRLKNNYTQERFFKMVKDIYEFKNLSEKSFDELLDNYE